MIPILGNPYTGRRPASDLEAIADAVLALAFEQRQANLIAAARAFDEGLDLPDEVLRTLGPQLDGYVPG